MRSGDLLLLSGPLYTGRDQTHKRLVELLNRGEALPIDLKGQLIYYVGPSPAPPGLAIGSAGPTTSYRMDAYTPRLLELGLAATMGKGRRSLQVREAMKAHKAVYLATIGGAGAYISRCIRSCEVIAFPELGTEALYRMEVQDLPAIVINDITGADFYDNVCK
jgi:fumarate hydratase subunit beta